MADITLPEVIEAMKPTMRGALDAWAKDQPALQVRAAAPATTPPTSSEPKPAASPVNMRAAGVAGMIEGGDVRLPFLNVTVPVASVLVGSATGLLAGHAVDLAVPVTNPTGGTNWINPIVKVAVAAGALRYGTPWMGPTAARFAAGSLILEVAIAHTPLRAWIESLMAQLDSWITTPVLGGQGRGFGARSGAAQGVLAQAEQVVARHGGGGLDGLAFS